MKEHVLYSESLALNEIGFDEECLAYYPLEGTLLLRGCKYVSVEPDFIKNSDSLLATNDDAITAPLYQQVFRWFRDVHKYMVYPTWNLDDTFDFRVQKMSGHAMLSGELAHHVIKSKSYGEAELACLKKLIEIVKI